MKDFKNLTRLSLATALLACMGAAGAQTITIGSGSVPSAAGGPVVISVDFAPGATAVAGYNTVFSYNGTILSAIPTSNNATCTVDDLTKTVSLIRATFPAAAIPAENVCSITFQVSAGAAVGIYPLAHDPAPASTAFSDLGGNAVAGTVVDGAINVVNAGPPTITISATPVSLPVVTFGATTSGNIPVTAVAGGGSNPADTASFTCTAPAGFTVAPLSGGPYNNGQVGTVPANLAVSCVTGAAAVSGNVNCTATNTSGSSVASVTQVTCPAGTMGPPALTPTPANGSTVTIGGGAPGATTCTSISIAASGGAGVPTANVTCSGTSGLTVTPAGALTFAVGGAPQSVSVCGVLTDTAGPIGNVTCTGTDGSAGGVVNWNFAVAAPAGVLAPANVPATSLWSKLALFGLFGALGMLILGLRRNH